MKIEARVEGFGLQLALQRAPAQVKKIAKDSVKEVSFAVEKRIKNEMPWDTGRARASWGHWTPSDIVKAGNWTARDAHWEARDGGLTIEQGSNVPYVVHLNQGTSTKAPPGFIDKAADAGARELTQKIRQALRGIL